MNTTASNILTILDEAADLYQFPVLDNEEFYFGRIRLKIYRSSVEWLLVFEEISYSIRESNFVNVISAFGNKPDRNLNTHIIEVIAEAPDCPFFDDNNQFILNPREFCVLINGSKKRFNFTEADYTDFGINLNELEVPVQSKIIRLLAYKIPELLFLNDNKILELLEKHTVGLNKFMELYEWQHPNAGEMPGQCTCFRSLAQAIAENDPLVFRGKTLHCNTHWKNWEWYKLDDN